MDRIYNESFCKKALAEKTCDDISGVALGDVRWS